MNDTESDGCGCTGDVQRAEVDPAYRRALWWVVILNVGFGLLMSSGGLVWSFNWLKNHGLAWAYLPVDPWQAPQSGFPKPAAQPLLGRVR